MHTPESSDNAHERKHSVYISVAGEYLRLTQSLAS